MLFSRDIITQADVAEILLSVRLCPRPVVDTRVGVGSSSASGFDTISGGVNSLR